MNQFYLLEDPDRIDESLDIVEFLDQLQDATVRKFSFFDETLLGYISVVRQPNEEITSNRLDVQIQGCMNDSQQIITLHKLELKPLKLSNDTVIYKFSSFINYPKMKLQDPTLNFTLLTNFKKSKPLKPSRSTSNQEISSLTNFYPVERRNLLGSYQSVRSNEVKPVIYETIKSDSNSLRELDNEEEIEADSIHLTKLPNTSMLCLNVNGRTAQISFELPIIRILNIKVKNFKISKSSIISTIDIELTPMFQDYVNSPLTLHLLNYKYENNLITSTAQKLPMALRQRDSYKFSYKLNVNNPHLYQCDTKISIDSHYNKSLIELHYSFNKHKLKTSFITNLDMSSLYQNSPLRSVSSSALSLARLSNTLATSITVRFRGANIIKLGELFKMKVVVQNHSKKPRELLITFNSSPMISELYQPDLPKIRTLIHSISQLSKSYQGFKSKSIGALSLVNELRFQLNSFNDIYENEIQLIALEMGVFKLSGIRVTDINTGESMNCDKLEVVVVE